MSTSHRQFPVVLDVSAQLLEHLQEYRSLLACSLEWKSAFLVKILQRVLLQLQQLQVGTMIEAAAAAAGLSVVDAHLNIIAMEHHSNGRWLHEHGVMIRLLTGCWAVLLLTGNDTVKQSVGGAGSDGCRSGEVAGTLQIIDLADIRTKYGAHAFQVSNHLCWQFLHRPSPSQ